MKLSDLVRRLFLAAFSAIFWPLLLFGLVTYLLGIAAGTIDLVLFASIFSVVSIILTVILLHMLPDTKVGVRSDTIRCSNPRFEMSAEGVTRVTLRSREFYIPMLSKFITRRERLERVIVWQGHFGLPVHSFDTGFDALIAWLREKGWDMASARQESIQSPGADIEAKKYSSY